MNYPKLGGGKILRSADPLNLEMPFEKLESFIRRVGLFMPRILTPGWDSTNQQICPISGLDLRALNKQINKPTLGQTNNSDYETT